ncbi:uncharacterized protein LOC128957881 [Oppia nitens]|uniref:uncharacterized protein LOC128957881 n=1 Tax=Oppia nitens TaxID=1686743 RepID=UPI0023DBC90F|nr:uncharacterized protein LOC128957881 [Oppia nitens]
MRICIIGAGAAGLCAARHLSQNKEFEFEIFEKTDKIGGIWNYTDLVDLDENGQPIHTSMYKHMRTNLPMEIMAFPDFLIKYETSFVSHTRVLQYLNEYTKHFQLYQYIRFNHLILNVWRNENVWKVSVKDLNTNQISDNTYDSVFVCNGRYSKPKIPNIKGLENFKGKVIHSHSYREPQPFKDQMVLVLGGGPSGIDIAIEVADQAKQVIFCHTNDKPFINLPKNIRQEISNIKEISENKVLLKNDNHFTINAIIWATGYHFDFSFLDQNCGINVNTNGRVEGIYLHLINQKFPSMAIWAIPMTVIPFPLYNLQILLFIKCLTRQLTLPSIEDMDKDTKQDLEMRQSLGLSERHSHKMSGNLFFQYCDKLSQIANIEPFSQVMRKLNKDIHVMRQNDITGYKNVNFHIISDKTYIIK